MKKNVKRFGWLLFTFCLFVLGGQFISGCLSFRMSEKEANKEFQNALYQPKFHTYKINQHTIQYVSNGSDNLPLVVFVHGSPGSWSAFVDFLKDSTLLSTFQLISVDRPGFGNSDYGHGEPSLDTQAVLLKPILEKHKKQRKVILVGHSLGGPLIIKMAMLYPELVDHLILVAGSVDPDLEPTEWYRKPMASKWIKWMLPGSIDASNSEIRGLKNELEKMKPDWIKIQLPVTILQGKQDNLVPPANAEYAKKMLSNTKVELIYDDDLNHFIPWKKPEMIKDALYKTCSIK